MDDLDDMLSDLFEDTPSTQHDIIDESLSNDSQKDIIDEYCPPELQIDDYNPVEQLSQPVKPSKFSVEAKPYVPSFGSGPVEPAPQSMNVEFLGGQMPVFTPEMMSQMAKNFELMAQQAKANGGKLPNFIPPLPETSVKLDSDEKEMIEMYEEVEKIEKKKEKTEMKSEAPCEGMTHEDFMESLFDDEYEKYILDDEGEPKLDENGAPMIANTVFDVHKYIDEWLNFDDELWLEAVNELDPKNKHAFYPKPDMSHIVINDRDRICKYFMQGQCLRKDCQFSHDPSSIPCSYFRSGHCNRGDECMYSHKIEEEPKPIEKSRVINVVTMNVKNQSANQNTFTTKQLFGHESSTSATSAKQKQKRKNQFTAAQLFGQIDPYASFEEHEESGGIRHALSRQDMQDVYAEWREEAMKHAKERNYYFSLATRAYMRGNKDEAGRYSRIGKRHSARMKVLQAQASNEIFKRRNRSLGLNTIDLHGLHRHEVKERLSKHFIKAKARGINNVTVIIGSGKHSVLKRKAGRIKPAVIHFLKDYGMKFKDVSHNHDQSALSVRIVTRNL
eukprot:TRINITY_DN2348_c0_g1_i1.p1 TRINITY_DN2348_c0_g1~~TRINITY_DN2348_c0_g1_i1.p1  ORF type:complete len:558 (+),score=177.33 TRINITY_DN2348_c0_g1_i1:34-1707(+)